MTLLIDLGELSAEQTNDALELIYKAAHDHGDSIWDPHESPFVRRIIELFTQRGLTRIEGVRAELDQWIAGARHEPSQDAIARPAGAMSRWTPGERELVGMYLRALPPGSWTLEDNMLLVDYLVQRYLPADDLRTEAQWLATRSTLMGRVQAAMQRLNMRQADTVLTALPSTPQEAVRAFKMTDQQRAVLDYAAARGAESVVRLSEDARQRLRSVILQHTGEQMTAGQGQALTSGESLQTRLVDTFSTLNRDWRRIAVTEASENLNQGYIASLKPGTRVKRIEQYKNACRFCRRINGQIVEVVDAANPRKDGDTQIWSGKTNIGRSASPRKMVDGILMDRRPDEMWWIAAGVQHPHCFISPTVQIYTVDGWRPIFSIKVGDMVLSHTGTFRSVNWVLDGARYTGDIVRIRVGSGGKNQQDIAEMTPEHPILTERGWVPAGEIQIADKIVAMAKPCAHCGKPFVNVKHPQVQHCSSMCVQHSGKNQFSTDDPIKYERERAKTADANRRRMRSMTVEQRRALTHNARRNAKQLGHSWLKDPAIATKAGKSAALMNYQPSPVELDIIEILEALGFDAEPQYRVEKTATDSLGRKRYWWCDIALPDYKICIEIDGGPWHGRLATPGRDQKRDEDFKDKGWSVLRFDATAAKESPEKVAEAAVRLAMNHGDEYLFSTVDVVKVSRRKVSKQKLYNFGVDIDESYIIGRGIVVHNCRGRWVPTIEDRPGDDPEFGDWLRATLGGKSVDTAE